jgi:hypothetical protein
MKCSLSKRNLSEPSSSFERLLAFPTVTNDSSAAAELSLSSNASFPPQPGKNPVWV